MAAMPSTAATAAVARSTWPSLDEWPSMRSMKKFSRSKLASGYREQNGSLERQGEQICFQVRTRG